MTHSSCVRTRADRKSYSQRFHENLVNHVSHTVSQEATKTRGDLTDIEANFADLKVASEAEGRRQAVLSSLFYPEYKARMEDIEPAMIKTLGWIFNEREAPLNRQWSSFIAWLLNGRDVYWIHGKAGSGKSTLCSFLIDHPQTKRLSQCWASGNDLCYASFSFWRHGSKLQKSVEGLLRSLLYQIVEAQPNHIETLAAVVGLGDPTRMPSWSLSGLLNALKRVFATAANDFCIAIDGLDEFEGETGALVELISTIR